MYCTGSTGIRLSSSPVTCCSSRHGRAREDGTPEPELEAQIRLVFDNLRAVLDKAGCTFDDVVDLTLFLIDPAANAGPALEAVAKAFPGETKPNATAVGVTWLAGFQFEVKVIARIPQK